MIKRNPNMIKHKDRHFVEFLRLYCEEHGITMKCLPGDWVFILNGRSRQHVVMGYDLGLNSSVAAKVCFEKVATFNVLDACGIPAVPHYLFLAPSKRTYMWNFGQGNWVEMLRLHQSFGEKTVVKQNDGTGGHNVFFADNHDDLEAAVSIIFAESGNVALSQFLPIKREVRFIVHDGDVLLCYEYVRPNVLGDGSSSVRELIIKDKRYVDLNIDLPIDLATVLDNGVIFNLGWKHKMVGASIQTIDLNEVPEARSIALDAFKSLGLRFASVDVVFSHRRWEVLEVHSGVMLERECRTGSIPKDHIFSIYSAALDSVGIN